MVTPSTTLSGPKISHQTSFIDILGHSQSASPTRSSIDLQQQTDAQEGATSSQMPSLKKQLSQGELVTSHEIRCRYGLGGEEWRATSLTSDKSSKRGLLRDDPEPTPQVLVLLNAFEALSGTLLESVTIENEHPLLLPWCTLLECILYHGWLGSGGSRPSLFASSESRPRDLFSLLLAPLHGIAARHCTDPNAALLLIDAPTCAAAMAVIENVLQFSGLERAPAARVRAWLSLALMTKCLGACLRLITASTSSQGKLLGMLYSEDAFLKTSSAMRVFLERLSLLDERLDFNLYVREQDIAKHAFPTRRWHRIIKNGQLCLGVIDEQLAGFSFDHHHGSNACCDTTTGDVPPTNNQPSSHHDSNEDEHLVSTIQALHRHIATLTDSNRQLRHAISMHLHSLSQANGALRRHEGRMMELTERVRNLEDENRILRARQADLEAALQCHELTNASLQRQLSSSFERSRH